MPRLASIVLLVILLTTACKRMWTGRNVSEIQFEGNVHAERIINGLYEPTGGWRWTARTFEVALDPPSDPTATYLELDCAVPDEAMEQEPALTLTASVNGIDIGRQTWYEPGTYRFTRSVPDRALAKRPAKVRFEVSRSRKDPAGRELGMIAVAVRLKPWEMTAEYQSQRTWLIRHGLDAAGRVSKERFPEAKQLEVIRSFETLQIASNARFQGIPTGRNPLDLWTGQQIIHEVQPDFVIETGSGEGGSALYWAHALHGLNLNRSRVITVDTSNRTAEAAKHPLWSRYVEFVESNPSAAPTVATLATRVRNQKVVVFLGGPPDPSRVHDQITAYAPLVSRGGYLVVENTYLDRDSTRDGAGPNQALQRFLRGGGAQSFEPDLNREFMVYTRNPGGWLRRK